MRRVIADELKEMRKGPGLPGFDMGSNSILVAAAAGDQSELRALIEEQLDQMSSVSGVPALVNALAIGPGKKWFHLQENPSEELTMRRRMFASRTNISERTLSRREDDAIENLSVRLARKFQNHVYLKRIQSGYQASSDLDDLARAAYAVAGRQKSSAQPTTASTNAAHRPQKAQQIENGVPSLVKYQDKAIKYLSLSIESMTAELDQMRSLLADLTESNRRLAATWEIKLD